MYIRETDIQLKSVLFRLNSGLIWGAGSDKVYKESNLKADLMFLL